MWIIHALSLLFISQPPHRSPYLQLINLTPHDTVHQALALATGASQVFPMRPSREASPAQVEAEFRKLQQDIAESTRILIVGGGPTGIEFAGVSLTRRA